MKKIMLVLAMVVLVVGLQASFIAAQNTSETDVELANAGITPASPFYGLDKALENIRFALTFGDENKAEVALKQAEERLSELREMASQGKLEEAEEAERGHAESLQRLERNLESFESNGDNESSEEALGKAIGLELQTKSHAEKISFIKSMILERMAENNVSETQLEHIESVFQRIEQKASEQEAKIEAKKERIKIKHKVLANLTESEVEALEENMRERAKQRFEERIRERGESEEKTKVEVSGEVIISSETSLALEELLESLQNSTGEVELKLKIEKEDNETSIEEEVEGNLTSEQEALWEDLKAKALADVESFVTSEDDVELEIEIEHEFELEDEDFDDDMEDSEDSEDDEEDEDESEEDEDDEEDEENQNNATENNNTQN